MTRQTTVVIVNWNGKACIAQCLKSLQRQTIQNFVTTVVDNGSTDGSLDVVRQQFPEVVIIALENNLGFAAANNVAIQSARTDYIALLNNDAIAHPQWLERLVDTLDAYPQAGLAASRMLYAHDCSIIDRAGDSYTTAGAGSLRGRGQPADAYARPEWIFGACAGAALYRMSMLRDIGLFDEDFFLLYEDVDLSFRAQLKGYKCRYVPEAIVYHMASQSIGYDSQTSVYYGHRNLEWVYFQNMPFSLIARTILGHMAYNVAAFMYFAVKGYAKTFLRAKRNSFDRLNAVTKSRRKIQNERRVKDSYIWSLLDREQLFPRLTRRLKS